MSKMKFCIRGTSALVVAALMIVICNAQQVDQSKEHKHKQHDAFADKDAVEKMAKNFESPERDAMEQPEKMLLSLGDIKGKKVMDIGAGTGYYSLRFARNGAYVIAADVSDAFQQHLAGRIKKNGLRNIELRKVRYEDPLLKDNEADIAFVANTYHHIENRPAYFSKVRQGLKPAGTLIILDFFKADLPQNIMAPDPGMRVSIDEVVFELRKAGFKTFAIDADLLPYHYIIKAK